MLGDVVVLVEARGGGGFGWRPAAVWRDKGSCTIVDLQGQPRGGDEEDAQTRATRSDCPREEEEEEERCLCKSEAKCKRRTALIKGRKKKKKKKKKGYGLWKEKKDYGDTATMD